MVSFLLVREIDTRNTYDKTKTYLASEICKNSRHSSDGTDKF